MLKTLSRLLAGATLIAVVPLAAAQGKLTILWAQWDPANYLQELVKDYEKQTGVKVAEGSSFDDDPIEIAQPGRYKVSLDNDATAFAYFEVRGGEQLLLHLLQEPSSKQELNESRIRIIHDRYLDGTDFQTAEEDDAALFQRRPDAAGLPATEQGVEIGSDLTADSRLEIDDVQLCRGESHDVSSLS